MALLDCVIREKCCSFDRGRGISPLFSSPSRRDLTAQETPPPGICHSSQKKMLKPGDHPGDQPGGGGWVGLGTAGKTDALTDGHLGFE